MRTFNVTVVQPNPELADKIQSLHSVTWDEMLEVVLWPSIAPGGWVHPSERDHRPSRIVVEGTTATGRQLMVVLYPADPVHPDEGTWRLGTAVPLV